MSWLLERYGRSRPLQLTTAIWLKRTTWFVVVLATIALLLAQLFQDAPKVGIDLFLLSHILYDDRAIRDATAALKKCRAGTLVIIRGASPRSLFSAVSTSASSRLLFPSTSHLWFRKQLDKIVRAASLSKLTAEGAQLASPDGVIVQTYQLTRQSVKRMCALLHHLHGQSASVSAWRFLNDLRSDGKVESVPNDDFLYVYQTT